MVNLNMWEEKSLKYIGLKFFNYFIFYPTELQTIKCLFTEARLDNYKQFVHFWAMQKNP